jgi:ABC-type multidrug transport system fused ATPase/permease subunit
MLVFVLNEIFIAVVKSKRVKFKYGRTKENNVLQNITLKAKYRAT